MSLIINESKITMLKIYNTLSGQIEEFKGREGKQVNLFVCGPTVYDLSHLGHARTYVAFDMFASYLKSQGYNVFYLQNITDLDDKIIARAKEKNISWQKLSRQFEKEYFADVKTLKIKSVKKYARATEHIKEIISQVERLLEKGFAYKTDEGVYYDVSKFAEYGKLSKRTTQEAEDGVSRIDEAVEKRGKADFCLWKLSEDSEASWPSPWGIGRPGWHIEDTAITEKYFGSQYDIHGAARDLIFPHHEAEIAQMEAISGESPLAKYWMHTGFLTIDGRKMSKSLGNFTTIRDFFKNNSPEVLRFIVFSSHYRSPIDFKDTAITEAEANLEKLQALIQRLKNLKGAKRLTCKALGALQDRFWGALEDDFNTPQAKAALFELISLANEKISQGQLARTQAKEILNFLKKINEIFLFLNFDKKAATENIPQEISALIKARENARQIKDWAKADELRKEINQAGWQVEDSQDGQNLKKI